MRKLLFHASALFLVIVFGETARGQDDLRAVIDRAIRAHGGEDRLTKLQATQVKIKGSIAFAGGVTFTQETSSQMPGKFREVAELEVMEQKTTVVTVFDGEQGWLRAGRQTRRVDGDQLAELQELSHLMRVSRLTPLKDKAYELASLGALRVEGRLTVGVKVTSKGHRDLKLYFDMETGLLAMVERRTRSAATMKEVSEERIYAGYQDVDGLRMAQKVGVYHDGKKFMEVEVTKARALERLDESVFDRP